MAFPRDLLDQAERLLSFEKRRPKQASLRRAISTAYCALFHLLVAEAARRMAPPSPRNLALQMRRSFDHGAMKAVCKSFAGGNLPAFARHLQAGQIEPDLRMVAQAFVDLQEKRHTADYDLIHTFTRQEVSEEVARAKDAFAAWKAVSKATHSNVFLAALTLPKMGNWRD